MKTKMKNFAALLALGCFVASGLAQADNIEYFECKVYQVNDVRLSGNRKIFAQRCNDAKGKPCNLTIRKNKSDPDIETRTESYHGTDPRDHYFDLNRITGVARIQLADDASCNHEGDCWIEAEANCELKIKSTKF